MKSSRFSLSEINQKFPITPLTTRFICSYTILVDNTIGDYVAHIKFTVLQMPNGSNRITSHNIFCRNIPKQYKILKSRSG
ncbi:hypothetical protein NC653_039555 [Populus alba x Populus x berolinensis]|uniref:Uncharacterized protein n=1 Tax=Populus alba x Populus x berolinensis TaxID=444605 RepID=A0AAD6PRG7_9ROSI|nr:hypothetical protein NC653_039555 [Populus alba x Populus x berolinensis]